MKTDLLAGIGEARRLRPGSGSLWGKRRQRERNNGPPHTPGSVAVVQPSRATLKTLGTCADTQRLYCRIMAIDAARKGKHKMNKSNYYIEKVEALRASVEGVSGNQDMVR